MQEIKYKVYVKPDELRQHNAAIYDVDSISFTCEIVWIKQDTSLDPLFFLFKDVELLQFIGAYDKNGQELYDGDIISKQGAYIFLSERLLCWCFKFAKDGFETPLFHDQTWHQNCEKIGNRFLNPELLGGEK